MAKKNRRGVMYSTDPDFDFDETNVENETLENNEQQLYVSIDRKQRKGKSVTLVENFVGTTDEMKDLAKKLKNHCGVGGTAKDGEILIQGDFKEKIATFLTKEGYKVKKKG
ncbi:MAG: translation initiation factor [Chitinophagales bacterium]